MFSRQNVKFQALVIIIMFGNYYYYTARSFIFIIHSSLDIIIIITFLKYLYTKPSNSRQTHSKNRDPSHHSPRHQNGLWFCRQYKEDILYNFQEPHATSRLGRDAKRVDHSAPKRHPVGDPTGAESRQPRLADSARHR